MSYPHNPGYKAQGTSREAAEAIDGRHETLRSRAKEALRALGPLTPDEIAAWMGESVLAIRPRLTELKVMGEVRETGGRRKNVSGRSAMILEVLECGT